MIPGGDGTHNTAANIPLKLSFRHIALPAVSIITALRFGMASLALLPFVYDKIKDDKALLLRGFEVGLWVALGYVTQAIGLGKGEGIV